MILLKNCLTLILLCTTVLYSNNATALDEDDISGLYVIVSEDRVLNYQAELQIFSNGEYIFRDAGIAAKSMQCSGKYEYDGELFYGALLCPNHGLISPITQLINFTGVTSRDLIKGKRVSIRSTLFKFHNKSFVPFIITRIEKEKVP